MKKTGKKLRTKSIVAAFSLAFAMFTTAGALAACADKDKTASEPYDYEFNMPFTPETDAFMTIDGVMDEEVWQNKNEMIHTESGVTLKVKSAFTQKGLYLGLTAIDGDIRWYLRNNFHTNSSFKVRIVKEGEPTYDEWDYRPMHPMRNFDFDIDSHTARSFREVPFAAKAVVNGKENSGNTESMTAELFLTWESMHYTEEELGENGYPDDVRVYAAYQQVFGEDAPENKHIEPTYNENWRFDTLYKFTADGFYANYTDETLGNATGGPCATDDWKISDGVASHSQRGTEIIWFKNSPVANFSIEAEITPAEYIPMEAHTTPAMGLIAAKDLDDYNIFSFSALDVLRNSAGNKKLTLGTARYADGMQALEKIGVRETVAEDLATDVVKLKMIKRGNEFYYFYNDKFWQCETADALGGAAFGGLFANDRSSFTAYKFTDYTGKDDELDTIIKDYVYKVSVPGKSTYGALTSDKTIVRKGDSVTLGVYSESGYLFTGIEFNGEDKFADFVAGYASGYTFTPDKDVTITARFDEIPSEAKTDVYLPVADSATGKNVIGSNYVIWDTENNLVVYNGEANPVGNILTTLPKAGTYDFDGRIVNVSGKYRIYVYAPGYDNALIDFELNDSTVTNREFEKTLNLVKSKYGAVTLQGRTVTGRGEVLYNRETGNYYVTNNAFMYFTDTMKGNYKIDANVKFLGENAAVSGLTLYSGVNSIAFKSCYWEKNNLCMAIVSEAGYNLNNYEISVNGFEHDITQNGGTISFSIRREGDVIAICDKYGTPKIYLGKAGIMLVNGATVNNAAIMKNMNGEVRAFFKAGGENALGMIQYDYGTVEFDLTRTEGGTYGISPGAFSFDKETDDYTATVDGDYVAGDGFATGTNVRIVVSATESGKVAKELTLVGANGETKVVNGSYNLALNATTFEFVYDQAYSASVTEFASLTTVTGNVVLPEGSGLTYDDVVIEIENSGKFENVVDENGNFSIDILAGVYNFRFSAGRYVSYALGREISATDKTFDNVSFVDAKYELSSSGRVNGKNVSASGTAADDFAFRYDSLDGKIGAMSSDGLINFMPNSVTSDDFAFSVKMSDINRFAGMGITDGELRLSFQVVSWENGGKNLVAELSRDFGNNIVEISMPVNPNDCNEAVFTLVKIGNELTLFAGSGNKAVRLARLTPSSYELAAGSSINERWASGMTSAQRFAWQKTLLKTFLAEGKEYMPMLIRNEVVSSGADTTRAAYEYSFVVGSETVTARIDGSELREIDGTITFRSDNIVYSAAVNSEDVSIVLPHGEYDYMLTLRADGRTYKESGTFVVADGSVDLGQIEVLIQAASAGVSVTEETADSITLAWAANETEHSAYTIIRLDNGTETMIATTKDGSLTASGGKYSFRISGGSFVDGGEYIVRTEPANGYFAPADESVRHVGYKNGVIADFADEEMIGRVGCDGASVSFADGLVLSGTGETEAHIKLNRSFDVSKVSYFNVVVTGSGNVTVGGVSKAIDGRTYFNLTPAQYNGGKFDVKFVGSVVINKIETDAIDDTKTHVFDVNGGGIRRDGDEYKFTSTTTWVGPQNTMLAVPESNSFTITSKVRVKEFGLGEVGFAFNTDEAGYEDKAYFAVLWRPGVSSVRVISYGLGKWRVGEIGGVTAPAIENDEFELTLVYDKGVFDFYLNSIILAHIDCTGNGYAMVPDGGAPLILGENAKIAAGFAVGSRFGGDRVIADAVTYGKYSYKFEAVYPDGNEADRITWVPSANGVSLGQYAIDPRRDDDGKWIVNGTQYFAETLDGDYTVTANMSIDGVSWGTTGLILNSGTATVDGCLLLRLISWEYNLTGNCLVLKCGDSGAEIVIGGYKNSLVWNGENKTSSGSGTVTVKRIGNKMYILDSEGVVKTILSSDGSIELVNGAVYSNAGGLEAVKSAVANYFAKGSETAVGMNGSGGKFAVALDDSAPGAIDTAEFLADTLGVGTSGGENLRNGSNGWKSNGTAAQYYRDVLTGDYKISASMSLTASSWGQIGLLLGGGASTANGAILLKGVPWAEGLWIKCGDSGSEIQVKGFAHTLAWNADAKTSGGTITFSVVRSGDAIYVYDEGNALKMVLSESGIRLVNGAKFGEANDGTMACDAVIRGYFDDLKTNGDKTAVGFWTGMISTADGFAEWNIARDDAEQTAPDLNGMLADGISGGSSGTAVLDSETGKFTVNGSRYFARSLDDDFTLTATVSFDSVLWGGAGIFLNSGTSTADGCLQVRFIPWENELTGDCILLKCGDSGAEIVIGGFDNDFSWDPNPAFKSNGTGSVTIKRKGDKIYILDKTDTVKAILSSDGSIELKNGAGYTNSENLDTVKAAVAKYFETSSETVVGMNGNGAVIEIAIDDSTPTIPDVEEGA